MVYTLCSNYGKTKRALMVLNAMVFINYWQCLLRCAIGNMHGGCGLLYFVICGFITSIPEKQFRIIWLNISLESMSTNKHLQQNKNMKAICVFDGICSINAR